MSCIVIGVTQNLLDDNKMITNDNIFAEFGDEMFFIIS